MRTNSSNVEIVFYSAESKSRLTIEEPIIEKPNWYIQLLQAASGFDVILRYLPSNNLISTAFLPQLNN